MDLSMPVTYKTPSFISAKLIEFEVCSYIAKHYQETFNLEIVEYLTHGRQAAGLNDYVNKSRCAGFITTLLMSHRVYDYNNLTERLSSYVTPPNVCEYG